jgi:hypothetical protein
MVALDAISRRFLSLACGAAVALASPGVHAGDAPLHLTVRGDLSADAVRDALARDARRPVVVDGGGPSDDRVTVTLRAGGELAVTFDSPHGSITRVVQAPARPDAVVGDASLLAASLAIGIGLAPPPAPVEPPPKLEPPPPMAPPPPPPQLKRPGFLGGSIS